MHYFNQIWRSSLFRISSLNSLAVFIKIVIGFVTTFFVANFAGTTGMALMGNLRDFLNSVESIITLGINQGIIKTVAQNSEDHPKLVKIISTLIISFIVVALITSLLLFFFSSLISDYLFGPQFQYQYIINCLAFAIPWYSISILFTAIINGLGKYQAIVKINIIGNIIGLFVTVGLVYQFHVTGALLSIILTPALLFFVSLYFLNQYLNFSSVFSIKKFDFSILKDLSSYTLMALFSGIVGSFVMIQIRNHLMMSTAVSQAGLWEAVVRISSNYLMFITTLISVYFLPQLSVCKNNFETKNIFYSYFKTIVPVFFLGLVLIYFCRNLIIQIIFSPDFSDAEALFIWQLLGDFFKISSMIIAYQMIAKKMTKTFILTEVFSLSILFISSKILIDNFGVEGIVMGYALTNLIYFILMLILFRKIFRD